MKFHDKLLKNEEKKCLSKKIECDRYFIKKERQQKERVVDGSKEMIFLYDNSGVISRNELVFVKNDKHENNIKPENNIYNQEKNNINNQEKNNNSTYNDSINKYGDSVNKYGDSVNKYNNIKLECKKVYVVDVSDFFHLNRNNDFENYLHRKIKRVGNEEFRTLENLDCLYPSESDNKTYQRNKGIFIDVAKREYNRTDTDDINTKFNRKYLNLKKSIEILGGYGFPVYLVSYFNLKYLLGELIVFGIDTVDLKNVFSFQYVDMVSLLSRIMRIEGVSKLCLFGNVEIKSGEKVFSEREVEKLYDVAVRAKRIL